MGADRPGSGIGALELLGSASVQAELRDMLAESQAFADLEGHEIAQLSRYMQAYRGAPATVLFNEGESGSFMCVVIEGAAAISKQDSEADSKHICEIGAGKTVGEMALLAGEPRSATCTLSRPTTLAILTRDNFHRVLREHPALGVKMLMKIVTLTSRRLRLMSGQLVDYLED